MVSVLLLLHRCSGSNTDDTSRRNSIEPRRVEWRWRSSIYIYWTNFLLIKRGALFAVNTGSVCWQRLEPLNFTRLLFHLFRAFRRSRRRSHIWYYRKCLWIQLRLLCKCAHKAAVVCGVRYIVIIVVSILYCFCLNAVRRAALCLCECVKQAGLLCCHFTEFVLYMQKKNPLLCSCVYVFLCVSWSVFRKWAVVCVLMYYDAL